MTIRQKILSAVGIVLMACVFTQGVSAKDIDSDKATTNMQKITFKNSAIVMAGNLFTPANFDKNKQYPAIVVTHPWGGVKEQTAGLYAKKLAEQGFIALAFDASHYGESGGEPRYVENPSERVEDIRSAVDYLSTLAQVNPEQIGALGICAGGGYTLSAAQTDARIKAVAGISIFDVGAFSRDGLGNIWAAADRIKLMQDIGKQRTREARGEAPRLDRLVADSRPDASAPNFFRESYDYYATPRGQHPNSTGNFRFTSTTYQLSYSAFDQMTSISPRPIFLVAGSEAESLYFSKIAYEKASEPKELMVIPGAYHFDLYDKPQYVTPIVEKLTAFFGKNL